MKRFSWLVPLLLLVIGCEYTPEGTMLFSVEGAREFDRAFIEPVPEEGSVRQPPMRLKWVDTNTWLTSTTLPAGKYRFTARSDQGGYYAHDVEVKPDQVRYELTAKPPPVSTPPPTTFVSGTLQSSDPTVLNGNLAVVFIGSEAVLRRTRAEGGRWRVAGPGRGTYRVFVHLLGEKPLRYESPPVKFDKNRNLGKIVLK